MKNVFSREMIQDNWHQCALYQFSYHPRCLVEDIVLHVTHRLHKYVSELICEGTENDR